MNYFDKYIKYETLCLLYDKSGNERKYEIYSELSAEYWWKLSEEERDMIIELGKEKQN